MLESESIVLHLAEVVPECLFIEIPEQVEGLDADVCAFQSALKQAPKVFESVGVDLSFNILFGVVNRVVAEVTNQSFVGLQPVCHQRRVCGNVVTDFLLNEWLAAIGENLGADLSATLQDSHDDCFVVWSTDYDAAIVDVVVHVASLAANESFVHFDFCAGTAELHERVSLHCQANPMEHEPCGLLSDAKRTSYFVGTDTVLAVCDQPNSDKPLVERERRVLKDCPDFDRELFASVRSLAFPHAASGDESNVFPPTSGAFDTVRPAPRNHEVEAVVGIAEVDDGLLKCLWLSHGVPHKPNTSKDALLSQVYYARRSNNRRGWRVFRGCD